MATAQGGQKRDRRSQHIKKFKISNKRHRESLIDLTWSGLQVRNNAVAVEEDGSEERDPGNKEAKLDSITSHSL